LIIVFYIISNQWIYIFIYWYRSNTNKIHVYMTGGSANRERYKIF